MELCVDIAGIPIKQIILDWMEIVRKAADDNIAWVDGKLHQFELLDHIAVASWQILKDELTRFKQICWWDEIELI